jgi:hypothetical protein
MNTGSGMALSSSRSRMIRRPVDQVVSTVKLIAATSSVEPMPPSGIFVMFDAK